MTRYTRRHMTYRERMRAFILNRFRRGLAMNPVPGYKVTYPYGVKDFDYSAGHHTGEDYSMHGKKGVRALALRNAVVIGYNPGSAYGKTVTLEFKRRVGPLGRVRTFRVLYCHLDSIHVRPGQHVSPGMTVGIVGTTGFSTGIHLHLEVRKAPFTYGSDVHPFLYKRKWKGKK